MLSRTAKTAVKATPLKLNPPFPSSCMTASSGWASACADSGNVCRPWGRFPSVGMAPLKEVITWVDLRGGGGQNAPKNQNLARMASRKPLSETLRKMVSEVVR